MNTRRDEIERLVRDTIRGPDNYSSVARSIADALIAAGLVIPEGMTAHALRDLVEGIELAHYDDGTIIAELRAWADALDAAVGGSQNAGEETAKVDPETYRRSSSEQFWKTP